MSDCLGIWFDKGVPGTGRFDEWLGDVKWFGRNIYELDVICERLNLTPVSCFWPEDHRSKYFDAAEGLEAMYPLISALINEQQTTASAASGGV